jgi:uncharacterized protein
MDVHLIILFSIISFTISIFSVASGGTGLILTPLLIAFGVPPATAIPASNFSLLGTSASGTYKFHKAKKIDYRIGVPLSLFALAGGILGSYVVLIIDPNLMKIIIGFLMLAIFTFTFFSKKLGESDHIVPFTFKRLIIGGILIFSLIFISTLAGGGAAILSMYLLILLFGESFLHSSGTQKIIQDISILGIIIIFIVNGKMDWLISVPMFFASIAGAWIGSNYFISHSNELVKNILMVFIVLVSIKMILPL